MRTKVAAVLLLATFASTPARAWCRLTTVDRGSSTVPCVTEGIPLAWRRRCLSYAVYAERDATGVLRATDSLSLPSVRAVIAGSFAAWSELACGGDGPSFRVRGLDEISLCDEALFNRNGGNVATIAFVSDWPDRHPNDRAAYAITSVWHSMSTGEIFDADIEINELRGPFVECPTIGCRDGSADLANVLTHEAGHFLGLAHSTVRAATMYPAAAQGETDKRSLESDDIEGFCAAYPPAPIPATCDDTPAGGLLLQCRPPPAPANSGCRAAGAGRGQSLWGCFAVLSAAAFVALRRRGRLAN